MTVPDPIAAEQEALVAAYALGALTPEENLRAQALVEGSLRLREVYDEALEAAAVLAAATTQGEPPEGLRGRILDAARRQRDGDSG